ncbi:MAG: ketopantoate reductase family protein [Eubacteriales bacterium]|jgi:2-dehydropantoate 2-reductase|nr:ketopantoate reductase family protein [Eubacteriales bacterium]
MEINRVSIIGLGALGVIYGSHIEKKLPGRLRVIADEGRIARYKDTGIFCNGERCEFYYTTPETECIPADLLIFAVKFNSLDDAVTAVRHHVGPDTVIISLLNGISSEEIIGRTYGAEKVLDCVAQGMDAGKEDNRVIYSNMGILCIADSPKTRSVSRFFDKAGIPYLIDPDMKKRMWGKFMLNVGVNQTVAVRESSYGDIQRPGPGRDLMTAAMREVLVLSGKEGVNLTEENLSYWLDVLEPLNPSLKPSMRQDLEAKRPSEVELFSGTVIKLGQKHGIDTPVNKELYKKIKTMESKFAP